MSRHAPPLAGHDHPIDVSASAGQRTLRTLAMVDFSVSGPTHRAQIIDLAVGITAPLGVSAEETSALARQALIRVAEDHAFTGAETAEI